MNKLKGFYESGDIEKKLKQMVDRGLKNTFDVIIADPPRSGIRNAI